MRRLHPSTQGALFVVMAMAFFAGLDTVSKYLSTLVPVAVAIWVRFMVQTVVSGAVVLPARGRSIFTTPHPWLQLLRGLLAVSSGVLGFISLQTLAVADYTAIVMLIPMLITLLSVAHLMEKVPARVWLLLAGGLAGALLVIRPGASKFQWGMVLSLGVVVINAVFQLLTSYLSKDDDPRAMHFYTGVVAAGVVTLALPFFWVTPASVWIWVLLLMVGAFGTVGHYLLILAYGRTAPSTLTPYLYFQIAFATVSGWAVFGHTPDRWAILGIVVITLCGLGSTAMPGRRNPALQVMPRDTVY